MPRPTSTLPVVLLLLGLCSGVALAQATAAPRATKPSRGKATLTCVRGTPSKEQCLVVGYLDACKKHRKECEPHVENGFREFYDDPKYGYAAAPTAKMLRPSGDSIPKDLRDGKLFAYEPPKRTPKRRSESLTARTGLTSPPGSVPASTAKNAHRRPPWENNGAKVKSCSEYAYEATYDWSRFTDATAACRGDWQCQIDIALMSTTPGIANRTLVRKDGEPIETQPGGADSGPIPKNDLFVLGKYAELLVLAGPPKKDEIGGVGAPKTPERAALIKLLEDGVDHYALGCGKRRCKGDKQFANAWDMHRQLYERNKTVSLAELEEYDRRKREFNRLLDEWAAAVERELEEVEAFAKAPRTDHFQLPFEWVIDPYDRLGILDTQQGLVKKNLSKLNAKAGKQKQGALRLPAAAPVAVFAAPRATKPKPSPGPSSPKKPPVKDFDTIDACESWPTNTSKTEFLGYGPYSCRVGRFLRQEYARMSLGQKSCLDPNDNDCDWSPSEFQRRFVEGLPYLEEQQAYFDECTAWMPAKIDNLTFKEVESDIKAVQKAAGQAWKELGPVSNKAGGLPNGHPLPSPGLWRAARDRSSRHRPFPTYTVQA